MKLNTHVIDNTLYVASNATEVKIDLNKFSPAQQEVLKQHLETVPVPDETPTSQSEGLSELVDAFIKMGI